jgi:hypothetical protein
MANRNLLKEAIADAKSVKEAAIANAKAALEEAFTPYLKERFSAKLAEMELEEGTYEEVDTEMEENYSEEKMEEKMSNPVMRRGLKGDDKEEKRTEKMREESKVDEMNLDELLAELDEEMSKEKEMEETLNEAEEDMDMDDMEMDSEEEEGEEDDEIDLEDMTEDELKDLIEDVIEDMVRAGELEAGEKFEDDEEEDIDIDMEDEEEIVSERKHYGGGDKPRKSTAKEKDELLKEEDINEIDIPIDISSAVELSSFALKNPEQTMAYAIAGILGIPAGAVAAQELAKKAIAFVKGKKATSEAEVKEMRTELEELASTLSEVKLLNAKLLYTNKIFRAKNLNETQKVKVLEAFDKAASVRDAKLIYETLTTVKETKTAVTESMRGMASKAAGMAPEKKPILEVNDQFARWQILAGIKRN